MDCPNCLSNSNQIDPRTRETYCSICGTVLAEEMVADLNYENNSEVSGRGPAERKIQPLPMRWEPIDGKGSKIEYSKRLLQWRMSREDNWAINSSKTSIGLTEVLSITSQLGLPEVIGRDSFDIVNRWKMAYPKQGPISNAACICASIMLSSRRYRQSIDVNKLAFYAGIEVDRIWTAIKKLRRQLGIKDKQTIQLGPEAVFIAASNKLELPENIRRKGLELLKLMNDDGSKPSSVAAGAILFAYQTSKTDCPFIANEIADACGCKVSAVANGRRKFLRLRLS